MNRKPIINANIYIVDYDPVYIASLKASIDKPEKYNISTFTSGEKFIAFLTTLRIKKNEIHIVFLGYHFISDAQQNIMNGIEILEAIKVVNPNIEVVMLYGLEESSYGSYARKSGAYAFIPKTDTIFLRISNIIMRIISQKKLEQRRRAFLLAVKIFLAYLAVAIVLMVILHFFILSR